MLVETMLVEAEDYYWVMSTKGRLLVAQEAGHPTALCTFYVLTSETQVPVYYDKPCWKVLEDVVDGPILYIDKLISASFSRELFRQFEARLTEIVPSWERAIWYRPGQGVDRRYTYCRRGRRNDAHNQI